MMVPLGLKSGPPPGGYATVPSTQINPCNHWYDVTEETYI